MDNTFFRIRLNTNKFINPELSDPYESGKNIEREWVEKFNEQYTEFSAQGIKDFCKEKNLKWSPYIDSIYGDIIIYKGNIPYVCIDIKTTCKWSSPKRYGLVSAGSLYNFSIHTNGPISELNGIRRFYILYNSNSNCKIINADRLHAMMKRPNAEFYPSNNPTEYLTINDKVNAYFNNAHVQGQNRPINQNDFVLSGIIRWMGEDTID